MKNKIFGAAILLCIILSFAIIVNAETDFSGYTPISSSSDLVMLMSESSAWGGKYYLTKDITLASDSVQSPIGIEKNPFTGVFDGNGHTISGLDISGSYNLGLFGVIKGATIQNLTVKGSVAFDSTSTGGNNIGGIIGFSHMNSTVKNCVSYVDVTGPTTGNLYGCGGIIAKIGGTTVGTFTIENCVNYGSVSGRQAVGGILGLDQHSGANSSTVIIGCKNYGTIKGTASCTAGVFGYYWVGVASDLTVKECANYGSIGGVGFTGGVIGAHLASTKTDTYAIDTDISELYNCGSVTGTAATTGGVIGSFHTTNSSGSMAISDLWQKGTNPTIGRVLGTTSFTVRRLYNEGADVNIATVPETVTMSNCVTKGEKTGVLNSAAWTHASGKAELEAFHSNHVYGYVNSADENGHYLVCFCGEKSGTLLGHRWLKEEEDGSYVCSDCEKHTGLLEADVTVTVDAKQSENSTAVNVNISSTKALGSILLEIDAPKGVVLTGVEFPKDAGNLHFVGADATGGVYPNPYRITALNLNNVSAVSDTVKLMYTCEGYSESAFLVSVIECYSQDLKALDTAAVGAVASVGESNTGDVDGDGNVTLGDALKVLSSILKNKTLESGDMNGDGKLTLVDVLRIIKRISQ